MLTNMSDFFLVLFFFSSRRRHTRWTGDWSSDVCSSDLGAGDIAVITPVADVILSAVPRERTGSAAAVNGAAIQIGGALGTAVLSTVLMAVARAVYYQRLEPSGLSGQEIAAATEALRRSIQKGAESG